jgi:hypothetical protein
MNPQPPNNSGAQTIVKTFTAVIIIVIATVFSLILWWWFNPPKIVVEADAGFKRAKQTIDPEQLRQWALESINRWPATNGWHKIPESEIPKNIQTLYSYLPEDASVTGDTVVIFWGGGFFHWALEIGSTNVSRPSKYSNPEYPYYFKWCPGIYYTREARWKLQ